MAKVINCDCGYQVQGETDEELLAEADRHIQQDHPEMQGQITHEQLLSTAEEA